MRFKRFAAVGFVLPLISVSILTILSVFFAYVPFAKWIELIVLNWQNLTRRATSLIVNDLFGGQFIGAQLDIFVFVFILLLPPTLGLITPSFMKAGYSFILGIIGFQKAPRTDDSSTNLMVTIGATSIGFLFLAYSMSDGRGSIWNFFKPFAVAALSPLSLFLLFGIVAIFTGIAKDLDKDSKKFLAVALIGFPVFSEILVVMPGHWILSTFELQDPAFPSTYGPGYFFKCAGVLVLFGALVLFYLFAAPMSIPLTLAGVALVLIANFLFSVSEPVVDFVGSKIESWTLEDR